MRAENKPIPDSVKESDKYLESLGAKKEGGKFVVGGGAEDHVWGQNKEVDDLRQKIPQDVKRLTEITGREELKLEAVPPSLSLITAKTPEGKDVEFDLNKEREYWAKFYESHNLPALVKDKDGKDHIPSHIRLTPEQVQWVKEMVEKHGFNRMMICPPPSVQNGSFTKVKKEMGKRVKAGLAKKEQYSKEDDGIWFSDTVKENVDAGKVVDAREEKPYIKLWRDDAEVSNEGNTAYHYAQEFKEKCLQGDTLFEDLIAQREFAEKTGKHMDTDKWGWLLDSTVKDKNGVSALVLLAGWNPSYQQVRVLADPPADSYPDGGARASAILYL
jgi:hypothetical protein